MIKTCIDRNDIERVLSRQIFHCSYQQTVDKLRTSNQQGEASELLGQGKKNFILIVNGI